MSIVPGMSIFLEKFADYEEKGGLFMIVIGPIVDRSYFQLKFLDILLSLILHPLHLSVQLIHPPQLLSVPFLLYLNRRL